MNILWICTDQQRMDTLGCYGNAFVHTPNLDRLAASGVRFTRAYSQSPVCAPSRASFLTGRYPRTCSVRQNGQDINPNEKLITKIVKEHGFTCGLSGKLHISACNQEIGRISEPRIDDGYDYFRWSHHPSEISDSVNWPTNDYNLWLAEQGVKYQEKPFSACPYVQIGMEEPYHQTTWCVNRGIEYMESARQYHKPWLFSVNIFDPHHPFNPPMQYLERYLQHLDEIPLPNYTPGELASKPVFQQKDHNGAYGIPGLYPFSEMSENDHRYIKAAYWAMIDLIDAQVGRLLDYLETSGQIDDTLVIFMSDHGESLGDHGIYLKGTYFYEENVHVPLLISYPKSIEKGRVCDALVELTDLAPTICEAIGTEPYEGIQGKALWGLLTGQDLARPHRDSVYSEYYQSDVRCKEPSAFATMVCDGDYKLVRIHGKRDAQDVAGELYDLRRDPNETKNLYYAADYQEIKQRMLELMCDRMAETCDPLPIRKAAW